MGDLELCCDCDQPTGRAGMGDDSIYTDDDDGPYCETCWHKLPTSITHEDEG